MKNENEAHTQWASFCTASLSQACILENDVTHLRELLFHILHQLKLSPASIQILAGIVDAKICASLQIIR